MTLVTGTEITAADTTHLERSVALAWDARNRGDHPFGSLLVTPDGTVLEAVNTVVTASDPTGHAETNLVRLAGRLDLATRAGSVLYTSTEPCAMCAGAIYWAGIGRVVFAFSSEELSKLVDEEEGVPPLNLASREVFARGGRPIVVDGPAPLPSAAAVHHGFWD
ncbi:putative cytidine/deoxycytidine deaminase [Actinoplanes missouriensis 431]|uniref:Putative cytidine/deoxycytidine deaminase n=1 Tax=Actinoplanes missouriensis (strain ATCC 14538 / DSM 43046 / CBS 188.64 / JCM 3121 / NBRC 102363 / NCIMB 12654 / NRRL B-3342 / UNCC 431) TaxID=512565 RepID=I0H7X9_ACTM4|nr:nucleoside deaminase [Actinoplanes missouriensis]BAL89116.1 putative cytidine/deoxycytidine deaminase [Actinoplanes missouriensis 431]